MSSKDAPRRRGPAAKSTRYLTKEDVRVRYGWASKISVDRAWQTYATLPKPTRYLGRRPLWAVDVLDQHDAEHAFEADV